MWRHYNMTSRKTGVLGRQRSKSSATQLKKVWKAQETLPSRKTCINKVTTMRHSWSHKIYCLKTSSTTKFHLKFPSTLLLRNRWRCFGKLASRTSGLHSLLYLKIRIRSHSFTKTIILHDALLHNQCPSCHHFGSHDRKSRRYRPKWVSIWTSLEDLVLNSSSLDYPIWVSDVRGGEERCGDEKQQIVNAFKLESYEQAELPWADVGCGNAVKIAKIDDTSSGHFAFEYTRTEGAVEVYFNLSDIDGNGPGQTGTTFMDADVLVKPSGETEWLCNVDELHCAAGHVCEHAYQWDHDDTKVKVSR